MASALARSATADHVDPPPLLAEPTPEPVTTELVPAPGFLRHEGHWLGWTLLLVGLVAVLFVVGLTLNRSGVINLPGTHQPESQGSSATSGPQVATTLRIATVQAYDPFGRPPEENDADARNAIDTNASTVWKTEHYRSARFGSLKPGVGLVLDAGSPRQAKELDLQLLYAGATVEIYGAGETLPSSFDGWVGNKLAARNQAGQTVRVSLSGSDSYRYYLIWFTQLPPAPDGDFQDGIAEASLKS
jgi:hypothetical protein